MPSIHPDFEYDIFISYRHNDNVDGWVTRFVEALQNEVAATLKNPVSIYFDKNPHDGLLDTHQVAASLEKKLKCLVFIPIISQTYCDENSFAWEHEFLPFVTMAKDDELGMNITLSNGNVSSRVLPIKIHDLDKEDQSTVESVLNGPIRSIDFVYKEPGVNRPLKQIDDRSLNTDKTDYRNQVNKVANSLKDIFTGITKQSKGQISQPILKPDSSKETESSKKMVYIVLMAVTIALFGFWGYNQLFKLSNSDSVKVTIAVLPFDDQSPAKDQEWLSYGFSDAIRNVLNNINNLQVVGKTSSQAFIGRSVTVKELGGVLNSNALVGGSVSKIGEKLRVNVQLTDVKTELQIWDTTYNKSWGDVHNIMDEVAQSIATSIRSKFSVEELDDADKIAIPNPIAYENYLKGMYFHWNKYWVTFDSTDLNKAESYLKKALVIEPKNADFIVALADVYDTKPWSRRIKDRRDSLVNLAFDLEPNNTYVLFAKALVFRSEGSESFNLDSAFRYYEKVLLNEPENSMYLMQVGNTIESQLGLPEKALPFYYEALKNDPLNVLIKKDIGVVERHLGNVDVEINQLNEALEINPEYDQARSYLIRESIIYYKNLDKATKLLAEMDSNHRHYKSRLSLVLAMQGKAEEALNTSRNIEVYSILNMVQKGLELANDRIKNNYGWYWNYQNLVHGKEFDFLREEPEFKEIIKYAKEIQDERIVKYGLTIDRMMPN